MLTEVRDEKSGDRRINKEKERHNKIFHVLFVP